MCLLPSLAWACKPREATPVCWENRECPEAARIEEIKIRRLISTGSSTSRANYGISLQV